MNRRNALQILGAGATALALPRAAAADPHRLVPGTWEEVRKHLSPQARAAAETPLSWGKNLIGEINRNSPPPRALHCYDAVVEGELRRNTVAVTYLSCRLPVPWAETRDGVFIEGVRSDEGFFVKTPVALPLSFVREWAAMLDALAARGWIATDTPFSVLSLVGMKPGNRLGLAASGPEVAVLSALALKDIPAIEEIPEMIGRPFNKETDSPHALFRRKYGSNLAQWEGQIGPSVDPFTFRWQTV